VWVAGADGSNARQLVADGSLGELSPDGRYVTYYVVKGFDEETGESFRNLYVQEVNGGKPRLLGEGGWYSWSPDGLKLAVDDGNGLYLLDVGSGKRRKLVDGDVDGWSGFSFAPDGEALAYARGERRGESDVFVLRLSDGKTAQLTKDGHSDSPVWGREWIAYRQFRCENEDCWPSIGQIRLMRPDGSGDRLFARGAEDLSRSQWGLEPREFSRDGKRLLACRSAEFSCRPVTFTVPDGKRYELSVDSEPGMIPYGADLAADGSEVLVEVAPFDGHGERVYAVPFQGGAARLLVRHAADPSWAHGFPQLRDDRG
jgi:dipeptidyl aminopeptidase/acylaminoacyl peptidase